jgi:hypothetical protein
MYTQDALVCSPTAEPSTTLLSIRNKQVLMTSNSKNAKAKKRGRWSALERAEGKRLGIALSEHVKQLLWRGLVTFYTPNSTTMASAYYRTLATYFCDGGEARHGCWVPVLKPFDELPTYQQFRYVWSRYAKDCQVCVRRQVSAGKN